MFIRVLHSERDALAAVKKRAYKDERRLCWLQIGALRRATPSYFISGLVAKMVQLILN